MNENKAAAPGNTNQEHFSVITLLGKQSAPSFIPDIVIELNLY